MMPKFNKQTNISDMFIIEKILVKQFLQILAYFKAINIPFYPEYRKLPALLN